MDFRGARRLDSSIMGLEYSPSLQSYLSWLAFGQLINISQTAVSILLPLSVSPLAI